MITTTSLQTKNLVSKKNRSSAFLLLLLLRSVIEVVHFHSSPAELWSSHMSSTTISSSWCCCREVLLRLNPKARLLLLRPEEDSESSSDTADSFRTSLQLCCPVTRGDFRIVLGTLVCRILANPLYCMLKNHLKGLRSRRCMVAWHPLLQQSVPDS